MVNFLVEFLSTPTIVMGIVALIGLVAMRNSPSTVITGTLKTILGFLVLSAGSNVICGALANFNTMFNAAFGISGVVPEDNSLVAAVQTVLGFETPMIMLFSFVINVILARITPFKYIFLTGHMMFSFAGTMAIVLDQLGIRGWTAVAIGSVIQGVCMVIFPAIAQPFVRKVLETDEKVPYIVREFLRQFVRDGGTLLLGQEVLDRGELSLFREKNPFPGIRSGREIVDAEVSSFRWNNREYAASLYKTAVPGAGWKPLASIGTTPVLFERPEGKGRALFLNASMPMESLGRFLCDLLAEKRIYPVCGITDPETGKPVPSIEVNKAVRDGITGYLIANRGLGSRLVEFRPGESGVFCRISHRCQDAPRTLLLPENGTFPIFFPFRKSLWSSSEPTPKTASTASGTSR